MAARTESAHRASLLQTGLLRQVSPTEMASEGGRGEGGQDEGAGG
jgi:hypothetical protein